MFFTLNVDKTRGCIVRRWELTLSSVGSATSPSCIGLFSSPTCCYFFHSSSLEAVTRGGGISHGTLPSSLSACLFAFLPHTSTFPEISSSKKANFTSFLFGKTIPTRNWRSAIDVGATRNPRDEAIRRVFVDASLFTKDERLAKDSTMA